MDRDYPATAQAAFEPLLEEIQTQIDLLNGLGAEAFKKGNYDRVEATKDQALNITEFLDKVASLRNEWETLISAFDIEAEEDESANLSRRDLGRLKQGMRTPEASFRRPILKTLKEMGGSAATGEVLDRIGELLDSELNDVDIEPLPSNPNILRWRNTAQWARNSMVKEGLLRANSPRGVWEISEEGRQQLTRLDRQGR